MKYALEEIGPNLERGFARFLDVYEDYSIIDGSLHKQGKPKYSYAPMTHKEIPSQLARLKRGDEAGVLQFARTYGSLGYQKLLSPAPGFWEPTGDPLWWIWAHSETIRFCLELSQYLQEQGLYTLKEVLCTQHVTPKDVEDLCEPARVEDIKYELHVAQTPLRGSREIFTTVIVAEHDKVRLDWGSLPNKKVCSDMERMNYLTRHFRNKVINANIKGMVRALSVRRRPHITERSYWQFTALIETAYWHLADSVDGGNVMRCEECHAVFIQGDKRQRFCPPPFNHNSSKHHSRCGTRKRVTQLRLRRKT